MFSLMLKNTDGICTSLLKANTNYRQTIIPQNCKGWDGNIYQPTGTEHVTNNVLFHWNQMVIINKISLDFSLFFEQNEDEELKI